MTVWVPVNSRALRVASVVFGLVVAPLWLYCAPPVWGGVPGYAGCLLLLLFAAWHWCESRWWPAEVSSGRFGKWRLPEDEVVAVIHGTRAHVVFLHNVEAGRFDSKSEPLEFAKKLGEAAERPVQSFHDLRSFTAYTARQYRTIIDELRPEELASVLPCAPRRELDLDGVDCFVGSRRVRLGSQGVQ